MFINTMTTSIFQSILLLCYYGLLITDDTLIVVSAENSNSQYIHRLLHNALTPSSSSTTTALSSIKTTMSRGHYELRHRTLDDEREGTFPKNISSYSVQYNKCGMIHNEMYVLFRLCPTTSNADNQDECSTSCTESNSYGEYLIPVQPYVEATTDYFMSYHTTMCTSCQQQCNSSSSSTEDETVAEERSSNSGGYYRQLGKNRFYNIVPDCTTCLDVCEQVYNSNENIESATNLLQCTKMYENDNDASTVLYTGPICTNSGTTISIGVFTDEYCTNVDDSKDVMDYMLHNNNTNTTNTTILSKQQQQLYNFYYYIQQSYTNVTCLSCNEPIEQNQRYSTTEDYDTVNEICESLYTQSITKCEGSNFIDTISSNNNNNNCTYLGSIRGTFNNHSSDEVISISSPTIQPVPSNTGTTSVNVQQPSSTPIVQEEGAANSLYIPILRMDTSMANRSIQQPFVSIICCCKFFVATIISVAATMFLL